MITKNSMVKNSMVKHSKQPLTTKTSTSVSSHTSTDGILSKEVIEKCRQKLIQRKENLLNQMQTTQTNMSFSENRKGDEADQTAQLLEEKAFLKQNERIHAELSAIEMALSRMEKGSYGLCEETGEPIAPERLLALPWTSLSIEGAEMRESMQKKHAR